MYCSWQIYAWINTAVVHRDLLQDEEEGGGEVLWPPIQSPSCLGPMETQGSSVPGRSKVRSQSGPRLECAGGPSSAQPASDPGSEAQNLGPTWDVFTCKSEGVCPALDVNLDPQQPESSCGATLAC